MTDNFNFLPKQSFRQRGVVLFLALIALVAMSLAAVALIRSVDTATMITGNLAFKQSATSSADSGVEGAIVWLVNTSNMAGTDPWTDTLHPLNVTNTGVGFYSSLAESEADPDFLFKDSTWIPAKTAPAAGLFYDVNGVEYFDQNHTRPTGNVVRYIVQRMCRSPNTVLSLTDCLFSDTGEDNRPHDTPDLANQGGGGTLSGSAGSPLYRITVRTVGPRNTVSFVQAYAY